MHTRPLFWATLAWVTTVIRADKLSAKTDDLSTCSTRYGPYSAATLTTTTSTVIIPCTTTTVDVSTTTIVPSPSTSSTTTTVTTTSTASTVTEVGTITSTLTITSSATTTSTETDTATTTVSAVSTSTIEAPLSFQPVQDTLPGATYGGSGGPSPLGKRENSEPICRRITVDTDPALGFVNGNHTFENSHKPYPADPATDGYPRDVSCVVTSTASLCTTDTSTSVTTVTQSTGTTTIIATATITTTIFPSATSTSTITSSITTTTTDTVTATTTTTSTTTSYTSFTEVYAACATNNFADMQNNLGVRGFFSDGHDFVAANNVGNAYECCVASFTDGSPRAIWAWYPGQTLCFLGIDTVCNNGPQENLYVAAVNNDGTTGAVIGNSACGRLTTSESID